MRVGLAVLAASVLLSTGARAQSLAEVLCSNRGSNETANLRAFRSAALKRFSFDGLDADGDSAISADETFAALTDSGFCAQDARRNACSKEDVEALVMAHNDLAGFWASHPDVELIKLRPIGASDVEARPGLALEPWGPALDEKGRFVRMRCTKSPGVGDGSGGGPREGGDSSVGATTATTAARLRLGRFLLGRDVTSLTVQRGPSDDDDGLKKVAQAELGIESNREAKTRSVSIRGVAGLRLVDDEAVTLIPFVEYVRLQVRDRLAGTGTLTGKLGLGMVASAFVGSNQIDFAPRYAKDLRDKSELLSGRVSWRPGALYDLKSFRDAYFFACSKKGELGGCSATDGDGLALWTDFQLIGSFGTILRSGMDPELSKGREFLRAGPSASVHVYGQSGLLRDFSFDVAYTRLFRLAGDGSAIGSFKADVNYWIAGSRNVSIFYGYERSDDEETLKRIDLWKLGFGVRF